MVKKRLLRPVRARAIDSGDETPAIPGAYRARANDSGYEMPAWAPAWLERPQRVASRKRVPCGGKRRRDGEPCTALSVPGKRRCKWHGGCSTGPRTPEGKAKVTANLPRAARRN